MHDFTSALDNGKERNAAEGSGCGSVGRVVASNSRGLRFESSLRQKFILNFYCQLCIEKTKIKEKRPGIVHFLKKKCCSKLRVIFFNWTTTKIFLSIFIPFKQCFTERKSFW